MVLLVLRLSRESDNWLKMKVGVDEKIRGCRRLREGLGDGRRYRMQTARHRVGRSRR